MIPRYTAFAFAIACLLQCTTPQPAQRPGSDPKAILIAQEVMNACGGAQAWQNTRYIGWNFFGRRTLLWDKYENRVRIDWQTTPLKIIYNISDNTGRVEINGEEQSHPDTLSKYFDIAKKVWINDSYWLVMPFKMLDPGVKLKYLREEPSPKGRKAWLLEMSFQNVGITPQNKYHVWVDQADKCVSHWAYFEKATDTTPKIANEWSNYQVYGNIKLSDDRSPRGSLAPVKVFQDAPLGTFDGF